MTSFSSTLRQLERAAERRVREAARQEKLRLKAEQHSLAVQAVEAYKELMISLTTGHKAEIETVHWGELLQQPEPTAPTLSHQHETNASQKLSAYRPSILDKFLGSTKSKIATLEKAVITARTRDKQTFEKAMEDHRLDYEHWSQLRTLAADVLNKNPDAYRQALEHFDPFPEATAGPNPPSFNFDPRYVEVNWSAEPETNIPNFTLSLTSTGKLSKKEMAASRFHELYRDYICSTLLFVGREVLALLPLDAAIVHIISEMVNPTTGHPEKRPILSAIIYAETMAQLNFQHLDPSEAIQNFRHQIDFTKLHGFKPVDPIEIV